MTVLTFRPLDILMLRGNRLFGGGVHGSSLMPPWPSVVAGALISRALSDHDLIHKVTRSPARAPEILQKCLGARFTLRFLGLQKDGTVWFPLPFDLLAIQDPDGSYSLRRLLPKRIPSSLICSNPTPWIPTMEVHDQKKPAPGIWINLPGLLQHLAGEVPGKETLIHCSHLWAIESRLGITIGAKSGTAEEGAIYTTDAIALHPDVSLCVSFTGNNLPQAGLVRLGGDSRAAEVYPADPIISQSTSDLGRPKSGWSGFRMLLATPGIFPDGWRPPIVNESGRVFLDGLEAELLSAAAPRFHTISGWDLATHSPKPATRVAPAGSCYWFRIVKGDSQALEILWEEGLWPFINQSLHLAARRHQGWNQVWFGVWNI